MRTLYVVTHPEATHHIKRVVGGQFDSELTPQGLREAGAIARRLAEIVPSEVEVELFTSDLRRTVQTAEVIATTLDLEPVPMSDLREKSYGVAGGKPQEWLDDRFIPLPAVGERLHHDEGIEGAETRAELAHRAYRAVERILASDCEHQIVVTHGSALTFVICAWLRIPIEAADYAFFSATSGGITVLREDDRNHYRAVASLNDISHLKAQGEATVITLCGSTRFAAEFAEVNQRLTMEGCVVISLGMFSLPELPDYDWTTDDSDLKGRLGGVHLQKIRMADEVYVVDPGGYVGESTRREIAYAESLGKPVRYLSRDPHISMCGQPSELPGWLRSRG